MRVTEEEARTKWCPESRVPVEHDVANCEGDLNGALAVANRRPQADDETQAEYISRVGFDFPTLCIGSACMWWQWTADYAKEPVKVSTIADHGEAPPGYEWIRSDRKSHELGLFARRGTCGKAPG